MKIECTPKEITDFVTELQIRLSKFETTVKLTEKDLDYLKEYLTLTNFSKKSPTSKRSESGG